jgi:glycosyltransferase involved in cell wall biosynthesis
MIKKKSILFVGHCYYNNWYLSKELRNLGWTADTLNTDPDKKNSEKYYHGEDFRFNFETVNDLEYQLNFFLKSIKKYNIFHFSNAHGMRYVQIFDAYALEEPSRGGRILSFGFRFFLSRILLWSPTLVSLYFTSLLATVGVRNILRIIRMLKINIPIRWDVKLLKRLNKKIVYTNNGCLDGVSKTSFSKWGVEPVCNICVWKYDDSVCSDKRNLEWGAFRNFYADLQILSGGNRADFNIGENIIEVPEYYCLDKDFWHPELIIPKQYELSKSNCILYHAVGNFESRSKGVNNQNIKCTHIYIPVVEELVNEGYDVELKLVSGVPNKEVRFIMVQCDIVVDMLTYGWFGANIREAMMLGKPCVCYLRPEWLDQVRVEIPDYVSELPIISATPTTIKSVLKDLITDPEKRMLIGKKSREFAVKWHSAEAGAKRIDELLTNLLKND